MANLFHISHIVIIEKFISSFLDYLSGLLQKMESDTANNDFEQELQKAIWELFGILFHSEVSSYLPLLTEKQYVVFHLLRLYRHILKSDFNYQLCQSRHQENI